MNPFIHPHTLAAPGILKQDPECESLMGIDGHTQTLLELHTFLLTFLLQNFSNVEQS